MDYEEEEIDEEAPLRCKACRRRLDQGCDVVSLTTGVMGGRGIVRLDETLYCSHDCLRDEHCEHPPAASLPRRIP